MRARTLKIIWTGIIIGTIILGGNVSPQTENRAGFAVSLDRSVLVGRPGSTLEGSVRVVATQTRGLTKYTLAAMDLGQSEEGAVRPVAAGEGTRSCAEWINIDRQLEIAPGGGTALVPYAISIPSDARGSYYGFIQVNLETGEVSQTQTAVVIQPTLSVRLEIEVTGMKTLSLSIESVAFEYDVGNGQSGMMLEVLNDGDAKATFEGDILLRGGARLFPLRAAIMPDKQGKLPVIYPGVTRRISCFLVEPPRPGEYQAEVRLRIEQEWRTRSTFDLVVPERGPAAKALGALTSRAEFDIDVSVEPEFVDLMLPPRASRVVPLTVHNRDTASVRVEASVVGVKQETNGFLTFGAELPADSRWVQVTPESAVLRPNSSQSLRLSIVAPDYQGEKSAMCAVRVVGTAGTDASDWLSEADIGVPVIAVPSGTDPADIDISELTVLRSSEEQNPTAIELHVTNTGGRTAQLVGKVTVERAQSKQPVQAISFLESDGLIIAPGVTREFQIPMPVLDKDEFRLVVEMSLADKPESRKYSEQIFVCTQGPEPK